MYKNLDFELNVNAPNVEQLIMQDNGMVDSIIRACQDKLGYYRFIDVSPLLDICESVRLMPPTGLELVGMAGDEDRGERYFFWVRFPA